MVQSVTAVVVDPSVESRLDAVRALADIGVDVVGEAAYGTEATFLATDRRPTLVLLALGDPPARGLATLEALQQVLPDTPVIVYSYESYMQLMRQAMQAGARDYIERPIRPQDLRDAVNTVLAQEEQRQLGRWSQDDVAPTARGTIITVAGAKGGIGKTTLATNLAVALRHVTGQEVALVDADVQFGDVGVMLDMEATQSIADLARSEATISRHSVQEYLTRHSSGVDVLLAADGPDDWRAVRAEHVTGIVRALVETHEYVVIDTPGAMNDVVAASLREAALVLLLTSLDLSSLKDTKTVMRMFDAWEMPLDRIHLVTNDSSRAAAVSPNDVVRTTGLRPSHTIAHESMVGASVQTGIPIVTSHPASRYACGVVEIASTIAGIENPGREPRRMPFMGLRMIGARAR